MLREAFTHTHAHTHTFDTRRHTQTNDVNHFAEGNYESTIVRVYAKQALIDWGLERSTVVLVIEFGMDRSIN